MRILAIDYGSQRIGLALSDPTGTLARPLPFVPAKADAKLARELAALAEKEEAHLILLGLPRNMDGSHGPAAQKVETFAGVLKTAITIPIKLWDERLTSSQANKILIQGGVRRDRRKEKVDKLAAAILLQSYLDGI